ncbi:hypothetical protein HGRIS_013370 [Hohenbuehelia grisea]|uniref:Uncharacterized protein n=1 Tax=Hohenbuehelia grisea TaxID=104357 RepID=A0ABR3IVG8_9AGAR
MRFASLVASALLLSSSFISGAPLQKAEEASSYEASAVYEKLQQHGKGIIATAHLGSINGNGKAIAGISHLGTRAVEAIAAKSVDAKSVKKLVDLYIQFATGSDSKAMMKLVGGITQAIQTLGGSWVFDEHLPVKQAVTLCIRGLTKISWRLSSSNPKDGLDAYKYLVDKNYNLWKGMDSRQRRSFKLLVAKSPTERGIGSKLLQRTSGFATRYLQRQQVLRRVRMRVDPRRPTLQMRCGTRGFSCVTSSTSSTSTSQGFLTNLRLET